MIITADDLPGIRQKHQHQKIVLAAGVFDLIHAGHVRYLREARQFGDVLVVIVKNDARVRLGKGPGRPIISEADRAAVVDAFASVDYTLISPPAPFRKGVLDPMFAAAMPKLRPDVFYSTNPTWRQLEELGIGKVIIGTRRENAALCSTTDIIAHIRKEPAHD